MPNTHLTSSALAHAFSLPSLSLCLPPSLAFALFHSPSPRFGCPKGSRPLISTRLSSRNSCSPPFPFIWMTGGPAIPPSLPLTSISTTRGGLAPPFIPSHKEGYPSSVPLDLNFEDVSPSSIWKRIDSHPPPIYLTQGPALIHFHSTTPGGAITTPPRFNARRRGRHPTSQFQPSLFARLPLDARSLGKPPVSTPGGTGSSPKPPFPYPLLRHSPRFQHHEMPFTSVSHQATVSIL